MVDLDAVVASLRPEHDHPANHQGCSHGDRVEQVFMDQIGEQHAQHHRREEGDQQIGSETTRLGLALQAEDHIEDLAPKLPDHGQDRAKLDDDVERHGALAAEVDQIGDDNLVPRAGDRQEFCQTLDHA